MLERMCIEKTDPLTRLCIMCIQEPIWFSLTEKGLSPFRSDPTIIIPYDVMCRSQLIAIEDICSAMQKTETYGTSAQMGGGVYVYMSQRGTDEVYIDCVHVLFSVTMLLRSSSSGSYAFKRDLSNVVLQRVLSSVTIPREQIEQTEDMIRKIEDKCSS